MRYFTLDEAERMIPNLTEIMGRVKNLKEKAQEKVEKFQALEKKEEVNSVEMALLRSQAEFLVSQINELLDEVLKLGAIPKGVDPYLVDFPFMLHGREVNLCWKFGEESIGHYHSLDQGFTGRKPLPSNILSAR